MARKKLNTDKIFNIIIALLIIKGVILLLVTQVPIIDDELFSCGAIPCEVPKITIYEWLT